MAVSMNDACTGAKNRINAAYNSAAEHLDWYINAFVLTTAGRDNLVSCLEKTCEVVSAFLSLAPSVADVGKAAGEFGKAATVLRGAGTLLGFPSTVRAAFRGWTGFFNSKSYVNQLSGEQKVFYLASITSMAVFFSFMAVYSFASLAKKTQMLASMNKATPWLKLSMSGSSALYTTTNLMSDENTMNLLRMETQEKLNPLLPDDVKCVMVAEAMFKLRLEGKLEQKLSDIRTIQALKLVKDFLEVISITVGFSRMPYARQIKASFAFCSGCLGVAATLFKAARDMESKKKENERAAAKTQGDGVAHLWMNKKLDDIQRDEAYLRLTEDSGQREKALKCHADELALLKRKGIDFNITESDTE